MIETNLADVAIVDRPRSMRYADVQRRRKAMLLQPHVAPLTEYAEKLRQRENVQVPDFDPLDGGVNAQILFLFEKPGPMTAESGPRTGSGFISRDNDDPTAEATFNFMKRAGIPRELTVIWNIVPWWNGTRKVTGAELREGAASIERLVTLLPALSVVVMVGRKAANAERFLRNTGLELFESHHPSQIVRARYPDKWQSIPLQWARALALQRSAVK
jgi:hypothetical protein